jgi:acetolactate synthase-1/2/3 large subunit
VEDPGDLGPAIERAFASGLPACINVMTDPSVISPVTMMMVGSSGGSASDDGDGSIAIPYYQDIDS